MFDFFGIGVWLGSARYRVTECWNIRGRGKWKDKDMNRRLYDLCDHIT